MALEEIGARLKLKGRREFTDDADKASDSVKGLGDEVDRADRKMRTMGGSSGGSSILKRGLGGVMTAVKTATVAVGLLGAATVTTLTSFIGLGMDAAETASAFNTVFGDATAEVQAFVTAVSTDFGIPTAELQDASRQFGVFAKAAGIPQENLAEFSTALTQAGLDMGSFYNADPSEVFQALQSGLSGETEPLRKFGIFLSDASLNAYAAARGIEKTVQQMSDSEKVALRQQFILDNLGDAQGDLARTSDGLANQWRGLKGRLTEAGTAIGTALLPYANTLVTVLNDRLGPIVAELTKQAPLFAGAFQAAFSAGTAIGTALLPYANTLVTVLNDRLGPIVAGLTKQAPLFAGAFQAAFSGGGVTTEAGSLLGIAERLGAATRELVDLWSRLSTAFSNGGVLGVTAELDEMLGTGDLLTSSAVSLLSIFESLGDIWEGLILPVLQEFNKLIPKGIRPLGLVATALEWIADHGKVLQPILAGLLAGFIAFRVVTTIIRGITAAQAAFNAVMAMNPIGLVVIALAALAAGLVYAWTHSEKFREIVTGAFNTVKNAVVGVWNWISQNWPLLLAILTGPFGLAVLAIVKNWDSIKEGVTGVKDWIVDKFDSVVDFFTGLPERITDVTSGMWDGIKNAFKSAINWIIDGWNSIEFTLPEIDTHIPGIGKIGGWTLGTPDIPRLHTGGTTTSGGMVNVRPDEEIIVLPPAASVVPMDSPQGGGLMAALSGSSRNAPIVLQVTLDGKVIAEAVYDDVEDRVARR